MRCPDAFGFVLGLLAGDCAELAGDESPDGVDRSRVSGLHGVVLHAVLVAYVDVALQFDGATV